MGVPKRKRSRPRRDKRFANKGLKVKAIAACSHCSEPLATHQVCKKCGFYKGAKVLTTKAERAVKRGQAKEAKAKRVEATKPTESQEQQ
ncbi:MAG TPA: 50S ribosomal protein L32 [Candidatus Babeliales bacterium]|nr:50S ribosomal protein L32 [Candidatus Babeliales bacterium]